MPVYTQREYAEMHFLYGLCNGNARQAAREYRNRHPNEERFPDHRLFIRVHNAYVEGVRPGMPVRAGRPLLDVDDEVLAAMEEDPSTSVRQISRNTGLARTTVHRALRRQQLHPFHIQRVQALLPQDYPPRLHFCREMLQLSRRDPNFFQHVLWTDEAHVGRLGIFNIHNLHYWAVENPRRLRPDRFQHHFTVNLWAGIVDGNLIGPFELPDRMNAEHYLGFLRNDLGALLENVPLETRRRMWFQHDGAPIHSARLVQRFLNNTYRGRWIGRGGALHWPPRSPDLNPIDFFVWGYLKEQVYAREVHTVEDLRARITAVAVRMRNNQRAFRRLKGNFLRRCRLCIQAEGGHFEHLM